MFESGACNALRILCAQNVALVVKYVTVRFSARDKLDYYLELEVALDTLKRKVSLLDSLSGFFDHVVVVVNYAPPIFVRFIGFRFRLLLALIGEAGVDHGADARGHRDQVEDGAGESVVAIERNNRVLEAAGASSVSHNLYNYAKAINLIF